MANFFIEGGFGMYPILVVGLVLVYAAARYMIDGEPVRVRFVGAMALLLLACSAEATVLDVSMVMRFEAHARPEQRVGTLFVGLMESSRPAILCFFMLDLALVLMAIGAYRVGRRELRAARGQ